MLYLVGNIFRFYTLSRCLFICHFCLFPRECVHHWFDNNVYLSWYLSLIFNFLYARSQLVRLLCFFNGPSIWTFLFVYTFEAADWLMSVCLFRRESPLFIGRRKANTKTLFLCFVSFWTFHFSICKLLNILSSCCKLVCHHNHLSHSQRPKAPSSEIQNSSEPRSSFPASPIIVCTFKKLAYSK